MKRMAFFMVLVALVGMVAAQQEVTADQLSKLHQAHKNSLLQFGHIVREDTQFSFAVVGNDLVSVARGNGEMTFYTENEARCLFTHLKLEAGSRAAEMVLVFDNKLTINKHTYSLKYKMIYSFGDKVGYIIVTDSSTRWNWEKCWQCVKCAGDNIFKLYNAYKECGMDWQCWMAKYKMLIDLYNCVKDNCVACFAE